MSENTSGQFNLAHQGNKSTDSAGQKGGTETLVRPKIETSSRTAPKRPQMYKVLMQNDDTTPFPFARQMLRKHFEVPAARAQILAMETHETGRSVVACFTKEIAEAKVDKANKDCRAEENPVFGGPMELTFTCEQD